MDGWFGLFLCMITCTVQAQCLPQAVLGTDIICQSVSGSGKTAVFVLAVLQQLPPTLTPGVTDTVILAHTHEMAHQISREFARFAVHIPAFKCGEYYGGVPVSVHKNALKNANDRPTVAVGTPGRMAQLIREGILPVNQVRRMVLDECDLLLASSLPMRADCQAIFKALPREKQVMMFSATMSTSTKALIRKFVVSPLEVIVASESSLTLNRLVQYHVSVDEAAKNRMLMNLLDALEFNQVMIFVSSAARANALTKLLQEASFPAEAINGSMSQDERLRVYDRLKNGMARILVSTDLFARGVDFERINIAINYDMPIPHASSTPPSSSSDKKKSSSSSDKKGEHKKDLTTSSSKSSSTSSVKVAVCSDDGISGASDTYLHRVGRSGRFGTRGLAISFISSSADVAIIESVQLRFQVDIATLPDTIDVSTYM